jgi:hypothetical protein
LLGCGESTKVLPEIAPALVAAAVDPQELRESGSEGQGQRMNMSLVRKDFRKEAGVVPAVLHRSSDGCRLVDDASTSSARSAGAS